MHQTLSQKATVKYQRCILMNDKHIANSFNRGPCILPANPRRPGLRGLTYSKAKKFCETASRNGKAGRLFEPRTQSHNDKVYAESIKVFGRYLLKNWIGIACNFSRRNHPCVYTSSSKELEFENWTRRRGINNCVAFYPNGKWGNIPCHAQISFICEFV